MLVSLLVEVMNNRIMLILEKYFISLFTSMLFWLTSKIDFYSASLDSVSEYFLKGAGVCKRGAEPVQSSRVK